MSVLAVVFFLNMNCTHRLLASEKKRLLLAVSARLRLAGAALRDRVDSGERLDDLAAEYASLAAFETRLRTAPTWPYNTGMLRPLFFTILVPLIVRGLSALIFGQ